MATRGYTAAFVAEVNAAPSDQIGVQLARICIAQDIPVVRVAEFLGMTRATIYSWFRGRTRVPPKHLSRVQEFIRTL